MISYLLVNEDGFIARRCFVPEEMFPPQDIEDGITVVVAEDGIALPPGQHRFDRRKLRNKVQRVSSYADALSTWRPDEQGEDSLVSRAMVDAEAVIDAAFARRMEAVRGPLAEIHAEKRRQAEAGGGPLIVDDADRLAILANAEAQDEQIAAIERRRREIKTALRAATSEDEIRTIMADAFRRQPA